MLTIHSGINQNLNSVNFGRKNRQERYRQEEYRNMSEVDKLKAEYENDEERAIWEKQRDNFEEMIADKEARLPKPMKTAMRGGAVLAAGVLGGMATGWSAKYIFAAFKDMYNSKVIQKIIGKFNDNISMPIKKGLNNFKNYLSKKVSAVKNTKTYKNSKAKLDNKLTKMENSKFVASIKNFGKKVSNNKLVQKVTNSIDTFFGFLAEGVVKAYNKIAGINYKKAAVGTLSVAGGISTGAVEAMDGVKKAEKAEGEE